ncbi:MAG: 1-acyl-sn-glycerol-3-phosphate acyltransferase [Bacteroidaceae bacterium]|nr:1-acyl-sn-glycerol-3-phosphate acyltransferase [Bacteroidaceae bacterium]
MPLLTLQELEQMTPLFRGTAGRFMGRKAMRLLSIDRLNALYDRHSHLSGPDFAHSILQDLGIEYDVFAETSEVMSQLRTLRNGQPFITISNHPYGSIDGIILADFFGHLCPSYKIMVNKILSRIEALSPSFISVTPTGVERTAATTESILGIRRALTQLRSGGALGLFPSGAVSDLSLRDHCIRDREWQPAIIRLIAKAQVPILPVRFFDGNSQFYYLLGLIDWRIRLLRLPSEVFNKAGRPARLSIAPFISVEQQQEYLSTHSIEEFGLWLRSKVYGMSMRRW